MIFVTHHHIVTIAPNTVEAQSFVNEIKRMAVGEIKIKETTVCITVEWYENVALKGEMENGQ